jgi:hypothetical protein
MEPVDEQAVQVKKDLEKLTRVLTSDDLNTDTMFSPERGIRACTPPFDTKAATAKSVNDRLRRVKPPE